MPLSQGHTHRKLRVFKGCRGKSVCSPKLNLDACLQKRYNHPNHLFELIRCTNLNII